MSDTKHHAILAIEAGAEPVIVPARVFASSLITCFNETDKTGKTFANIEPVALLSALAAGRRTVESLTLAELDELASAVEKNIMITLDVSNTQLDTRYSKQKEGE